MKNYTSIEQAKKLAEFLPLESANMCYKISPHGIYIPPSLTPYIKFAECFKAGKTPDFLIPCWSLVALLNILPSSTLDSSDDHHYRVHCKGMFTDWYDNPIDCCIAMIDRLHEQMIYDFNNS